MATKLETVIAHVGNVTKVQQGKIVVEEQAHGNFLVMTPDGEVRSAVTKNTGKLTAMAKRGYSREFPQRSDRRIKREIDRVPPTLDAAVQAKCKREGISLRALTLRLWKEWAASPSGEER